MPLGRMRRIKSQVAEPDLIKHLCSDIVGEKHLTRYLVDHEHSVLHGAADPRGMAYAIGR